MLHERCIHLAKKNELPLRVMTFKDLDGKVEEGGTYIGGRNRGGKPPPSYEKEKKV